MTPSPTPLPTPHRQVSELFPDAPAGIDTPDSVRAVYRIKLRSWRIQHATLFQLWRLLVIGAPVAAAVGVLLASEPPLVALQVAGMVLVPFVLAAAVVAGYLWTKSDDTFWSSYGHARGLQHTQGGNVHRCVPLLERGDERECHHTLFGRVAGFDARVVCYTYTEITHSTDSNGRSSRSRYDYDHTLLMLPLPQSVAARFRGVYCRRRGISLGGLQDKLAHDRAVTLESADFAKRYSLRVVDDQDDIALYELFSTTFIEQLSGQEFLVEWEQVGSDLVLYVDRHLSVSSELDVFCLVGSRVHARYLQEHM